jgi:metal-responsive CopG/Arc/MetJ family transcriptional regulator
MPRRQTTIRLTESLVDELDREADEQGITRSEHIRQILSERHETTVNAQRLEAKRIEDRLHRYEDRLMDVESRLRHQEHQQSKETQSLSHRVIE